MTAYEVRAAIISGLLEAAAVCVTRAVQAQRAGRTEDATDDRARAARWVNLIPLLDAASVLDLRDSGALLPRQDRSALVILAAPEEPAVTREAP